MKLMVLAAACLLITAGITSNVPARTLVVPAEFAQVSDAIREAVYGDTILVHPGRYRVQERLRSGVKLLSVKGPDSTILWNRRWYILKLIDCDMETVVSGFTFAGKGSNICVACTTGAPSILDNVIKDSWDGISLYRCNAYIKGNRITGCNRGIDMDRSDPEIVENEFFRNGDALSIVSSSPIIARCTFDRNSRAILILGHSYPTIGGSLNTANDILKNGYTIYNAGLRIEGTSYTDKPEVAVATYNYWGSDCPDEKRMRGEVVIRPWTNAAHDTLYEECPQQAQETRPEEQ